MEEKPSSESECGPEECERGGRWETGPWSVCSVPCGGYGVQTRPVSCRPGSRCEGERPLTSRHCRGLCSQHLPGSGWVRLEDGAAREDPPDMEEAEGEEEEGEMEEEMEERKPNVTEGGRGRAEFLETSGQLSLSPHGKSLIISLCAVLLYLVVQPDEQ